MFREELELLCTQRWASFLPSPLEWLWHALFMMCNRNETSLHDFQTHMKQDRETWNSKSEHLAWGGGLPTRVGSRFQMEQLAGRGGGAAARQQGPPAAVAETPGLLGAVRLRGPAAGGPHPGAPEGGRQQGHRRWRSGYVGSRLQCTFRQDRVLFSRHAFLRLLQFGRASADVGKILIGLSMWDSDPQRIVLHIKEPARFSEHMGQILKAPLTSILKDELFSRFS